MRWLEEIHVRFSKNDFEQLKKELIKLRKELNKEKDIQLQLYQNKDLNSDFKLHLIHNSEMIEITPIGMHIKSELENFGRVNHSTWLEVNDNEGENNEQ